MKEINQDKVPNTLDEAVQMLYDSLDYEDLVRIRGIKPESVHFTFGMTMRNTWSLWEDTPLTRDIKQRFKIFGHGDDMSGIIMRALWLKVVGTPPWLKPEHTLEAEVENYRVHWRKHGVDPETGKKL